MDVVLFVSPRYVSSTIGDSLGLFPVPLPWVDTLDGFECPDTIDLPDLKCIKTSQVYKLGSFVKPLKCNFNFPFCFFFCTTSIFMVLDFMVMVALSSLRLYGYGFFLWFLCHFLWFLWLFLLYIFYGFYVDLDCNMDFAFSPWLWLQIQLLVVKEFRSFYLANSLNL